MKQGLEMWDKVADKIINKERIVAGRNRGKIPYTTVSPHVFDDQSPKEKVSWWINGRFMEEEVFPLKEIRYHDRYGTGAYGPVELIFRDGAEKSIDFDGIEGRLSL